MTSEIIKIIKQLEKSLPPDESGRCYLDVETVTDLLEILSDLPFQMNLLDICIKRIDQVNNIGREVRDAENKGKMYRQTAKKLGFKTRILRKAEVRSFSPSTIQVVIDFKAKKV